jgi:uncharacterized membrane protein YdjX (TVP38/TMEM64 family)
MSPAEVDVEGGLRRNRRGLRRYIGPKRVVLLLLIATGAGLAWHARGHGLLAPAPLQRFLADHPLEALGLFTLVYAVSIVAMLPTAPLNLAAGLFWGPVWGGLVATLGAGAGSLAAFFAARLLFGQPLARRFNNRLVATVQREFERKGWRFVAFARLNPVFPTGPLNYLLGLTAISSRTYAWATVAFLLPPSIAVAVLGHEAGAFVVAGNTAYLLHAFLIASAAVTFLFGIKFAVRLLDRSRAPQIEEEANSAQQDRPPAV